MNEGIPKPNNVERLHPAANANKELPQARPTIAGETPEFEAVPGRVASLRVFTSLYLIAHPDFKVSAKAAEATAKMSLEELVAVINMTDPERYSGDPDSYIAILFRFDELS